jgi:ubiquinone/menaquinone biosynthesis C-methylase UbiE
MRPFGMSFEASAVRHLYENIADVYAGRFGDDLEHSLVDSTVLKNAVDILPPSALVLDLGCGPGPVASYLMASGCEAVGIDLTPKMLGVARQVEPNLALINANVLRLPVRDGYADGAIAWFALHNLPRSLLSGALAQVRRALRPDGVFVMATHGGDGEESVAHNWRGRTEHVPVIYYSSEQLRSELARQQLSVVDVRSRPPMEHEHAVAKMFVTAIAQ